MGYSPDSKTKVDISAIQDIDCWITLHTGHHYAHIDVALSPTLLVLQYIASREGTTPLLLFRLHRIQNPSLHLEESPLSIVI